MGAQGALVDNVSSVQGCRQRWTPITRAPAVSEESDLQGGQGRWAGMMLSGAGRSRCGPAPKLRPPATERALHWLLRRRIALPLAKDSRDGPGSG